MYTTNGTGFGKFSQTYHIGTRKYGHKLGHQEQKEKKTPTRRKSYGFLNTRIPSIAPDLYVENDMEATINVTTKENLDFLYRSAMKYGSSWMWSCHTILQAGLPQEKKYACYIMRWIP